MVWLPTLIHTLLSMYITRLGKPLVAFLWPSKLNFVLLGPDSSSPFLIMCLGVFQIFSLSVILVRILRKTSSLFTSSLYDIFSIILYISFVPSFLFITLTFVYKTIFLFLNIGFYLWKTSSDIPISWRFCVAFPIFSHNTSHIYTYIQ